MTSPGLQAGAVDFFPIYVQVDVGKFRAEFDSGIGTNLDKSIEAGME